VNAPVEPEQPALLGLDDVPGATAPRRPATAKPMADVDPVARVVLDLQPAHLDREYDYLVPAAMADSAVPGVRVRARFGPQEVAGYVVARTATSDHDGRLQPLRRVVSADPVLTPEVLALARTVAQRYAGTLADVLRLAVPPRHARVEGEVLAALDGTPDAPDAPGVEPPSGPGFEGVWAPYQGGEAFCRRILAGEAPRAVWTPLPGLERAPDDDVARVPHWAAAVAQAVRSAVGGGRRALVVVPDARDVALAADALAACGVQDVVRLQADDGPAPRYRAFLRARHGLAAVVVGTRAAMFAPLPDLGLVVLWGDGEQTLAEPHAPYPHARDVLALRSEQQGAASPAAGRTTSHPRATCCARGRRGCAP
jgi:primosomal protein N' (replication factor Y)